MHTDVCTYNDIITKPKISRIDGLPYFLTYGALHAPLAHGALLIKRVSGSQVPFIVSAICKGLWDHQGINKQPHQSKNFHPYLLCMLSTKCGIKLDEENCCSW